MKIKRISGDETIDIVLDTVKKNKQALVFLNNRRSSEAIAERISKFLNLNNKELSEKIKKVISPPTEQCKKLSECIKKGSAFHHSGLVQKQRELIEDAFKKGDIKVICSTPTLGAGINTAAFRSIIKSLKRYSGWGMDWIPTLEYKQFCGRCGRPGFEEYGEAITIALSEKEREIIKNKYVFGDIEDIQSKLAVEPVLRTYVLALIASSFVMNRKQLIDFFKKTFWAQQFGDFRTLEKKISSVISLLEKYGFIKEFEATKLGKRVSELYLDPETGYFLIRCLKKGVKNPFFYLNSISNTLEMKPLFSVRKKELEILEEQELEYKDYIVDEEGLIMDYDYLKTLKLTCVLFDWINEVNEQDILKKYNIRPGELRYKMTNADWLVYAMKEIDNLIKNENGKELLKMRIRLKYGIKEELLPLIKLKNIGRVRARKLYNKGIKDIKHLKKASIKELSVLVGDKIAENIKAQL